MINIRVDMERLEQTVTLDEFLLVQNNDLEATINMMSKFVLSENGDYLTPKEGRALIGKMTIAEMKDITKSFGQKISDAAVPPENVSD